MPFRSPPRFLTNLRPQSAYGSWFNYFDMPPAFNSFTVWIMPISYSGGEGDA